MEAGRISHKQGLLRAQKLLVKFPGQLEIQNFIANRLWSLEMRDESTDVREKAYRQASSLIAPGFKGQISWGEVEPFAVSLAASGICGSCALATKAILNSFAARAQLPQRQGPPVFRQGPRYLLESRPRDES